jgi:uncharacterized protein (DUF362 family)
MGPSRPDRYSGVTRRGFLTGAAAGLVTGVPLGWLGWQLVRQRESFTGRTEEDRSPALAMPGPYPGRVIEVRDPGAVNDRNEVSHNAVRRMMARGMRELTGADHESEAWKRFFQKGDRVGIKVNPVGMARAERPEAAAAVSSPAVLIEVVAGLKSTGVKAKDIVVFERYANEFRQAGYEKVMAERALEGVRWCASSSGYDDSQLNIDGLASGRGRDTDPHVVGYDPDVFVQMGFASPGADPKDDRRFRSHLSVIVTKMVDKIVTLPVLKDHRSAGITMALKNLSHGINNNVARSHLPAYFRHSGAKSEPNQCNTFIPLAAGQLPTRQKATLHIGDGLIGVYEGGPGCWNPTWGTWRRKSLFFATDPVAMDHVGWDIIDAKRARLGWPPVARMGHALDLPAVMLSTRLQALAAAGPLGAVSAEAAGLASLGNQETEQFDRRQPEHVILAATIGMGVFDASEIEHRVVRLGERGA